MFDPRVTPARAECAAERLRGQVEARRFSAGAPYRICAPVAALRAAPAAGAEQLNQALAGEDFTVYDRIGAGDDQWVWGQLSRDLYVGWIEARALSPAEALPAITHSVLARRTFAFSRPDLKSPPRALLSRNCRIAVTDESGRFSHDPALGWIVSDHLATIGTYRSDAVSVCVEDLGAVYQWGGVEHIGLDCSGLIQMAFLATGLAVPRDTDMQRRVLGDNVPVSGLDPEFAGDPRETGAALLPEAELRRGDLVFWQGHVGMMCDSETLLHANAFHMAARMEPLEQCALRLLPHTGPILAVKRVERGLHGRIDPPDAG